jgi:hypothetical protein
VAGQEPFLLEGGMSQPTLGQVAATMGRNVPGVSATPGAPAPHVSVIVLVLAAVIILLLLHKAGFRFAVTAGRG